MPVSRSSFRFPRRAFLGAELTASVSHFCESTAVISARAANVIKIWARQPITTGPVAALGRNELIRLSAWRSTRSMVRAAYSARRWRSRSEDSDEQRHRHSGLTARKLIDGDSVDFLQHGQQQLRSVARDSAGLERGILQIVPGGHTDAVTGVSCHWNVFRVCNTTQMEAGKVAASLIKQYGKKVLLPRDRRGTGHTLEAGMVRASAPLGAEQCRQGI